MGLSQRDLLLEMRDDIKALAAKVDAIVRDQATAAERNTNMQVHCAAVHARINLRDRDQDIEMDDMRQWRDRADGALLLARWALGASLISLAAVILQIADALP